MHVWRILKTVRVLNSVLCFEPVCMGNFTLSQLRDAVSCLIVAAACMNDEYLIRPITNNGKQLSLHCNNIGHLDQGNQSDSFLCPRWWSFHCMCCKIRKAMMSAKENPQAQLVEELRCLSLSRWRTHEAFVKVHVSQSISISKSELTLTICCRTYPFNFANLTVKRKPHLARCL